MEQQQHATGDRPKVFGIGLHKTSTTSLANALYTLGYHVGGYFDASRFADDELLAYVIDRAGFYDAVQDMPWPEFYQLLDREFPGSKFILTVRDEDRWIRSVTDHFGEGVIADNERFYGVPTAAGNEDVYRDRFRRHNQEVRDHFADRPDDLLVMDIANGDGWDVLGPFLGVATPDWPFPRQNAMSLHRATRVQRRANAVLHSALRRTGLDERVPGLQVVDAEFAYARMHAMSRTVDEAVAGVDAASDDRARGRLEAVVKLWLEDLATWAAASGTPPVPDDVAASLDAWQIGTAWGGLRPSIRQWAADLTDDGGGIRNSEGGPASDAVTAALATEDRYLDALARVSGVSRVAPHD